MQQKLGKKSGPRIIALFPYKVKAAAAIILLMVVSATVWFILRPGDDETKMATATPEIRETTPIDESVLHDAELPAEEAVTDLLDTQLAEIPADREKDILTIEYKAPEKKHYTPTALEIADKEEVLDEKPVPVLIAEAEKETPEPEAELADVFTVDHEKSVQEKIAVNGLSSDIRYPDIIPVQRSRGSSIQFLAGPMVTYTTGEIAEGIGFSAGVTGDFPVFENLSINTGGILVYNQFGFDDNSMFGVAMEALPNYYGSDDLMVIDETGYVDYEFMAVDFPLNLRMQILNDNRKQFYVSAGVSSFLYLQQSYSKNAEMLADVISEDFSGQTTIQRNFSSVSTSGSFDAFRRFDLARFLNLSAGYVVKRENYNMIIEPYLKYPMYNVTSFDLKIGMAGVSLIYQLGGR
ncbi:MAG: hypothetical protein EA393_03075 [Bacteroidetes bacterium]|nr:MAG: hypothetical protein EA393_03075 [Bacteroidota bacterium]